LGSEVGALDIFADDILYKKRIEPGKMLLVDLEKGIIVPDDDIKMQIASEQPYKEWLKNKLDLDDLPEVNYQPPVEEDLIKLQQAFGYTREELNKMIKPLIIDGKDPIGSMGYDSPLAVLSKKPQLLYNYFKQLFAQVTNPPIDAIREKIITMTETTIGAEGNLVRPTALSCRQIRLGTPILKNEELEKLRVQQLDGFKAETLPIHFETTTTKPGMEKALNQLFLQADQAIKNGAVLLILSDRGIGKEKAAIPALLAVSGLHHHLIRQGIRTKVSLLLETGEPREVHHFAALLGYGAEAINPYLAIHSIFDNTLMIPSVTD
jgi:glutamate synthase (NADPH) large chain